jgi:hypothetical protein
MLSVAGCGGGGSALSGSNGGGGTTPSGPNVQAVTVDTGPSGLISKGTTAVNTLYTSVTICIPGTSNCQTIDHIQVDTGSSGLRIINSELSLSLPQKKDSTGTNSLAECVQFVDGSSWGTLRSADIKISGETASNQVVQVIGDPAFTVPTACTGTAENDVGAFGANGILGVGPFIQDCGPSCTVQGGGVYFSCTTASNCIDTAMPLAAQVSNPVASFATDNNGVLIQVGSVSGTAASVSGFLIFGIGTQGNNGLGSAKVFTLSTSGAVAGSLTTTYKGSSLTQSFIDSGSNALFFPDTIPTCTTNPANGFYCPTSTLNLTATIVGVNGTSAAINFSVDNANSLFPSSTTVAAASALAAPSTAVNSAPDPSGFDGSLTFDWGLNFYYGRSVFTAIENQNTSAGMGPYFAF